jgi:hypothetical protein
MDTAVGPLIIVVIVAAALWFGIRWFVRSRAKYGGERVITCPETRNPAVVEVDSLHASLTGLVGPPDIRLENCSRWPMKQDCGQECLTSLDVAPDTCLVSAVLMRWYRGKNCVYCKKPFTEVHWLDHRPALLNPDKKLVSWNDVEIDKVPSVLETHFPVCWDCYIAQTFRVEHSDLVTFRPRNETSADANRSSASRHA